MYVFFSIIRSFLLISFVKSLFIYDYLFFIYLSVVMTTTTTATILVVGLRIVSNIVLLSAATLGQLSKFRVVLCCCFNSLWVSGI